MDKVKTKIELYLKIYFQIRFYLFLASFHYLVFNYNFTFQINTDNLVFLFMYIFAIILMVFSWFYCFLLSRIITKGISKKSVFYVNSTLMTLSLSIFIYAGFLSENNSIQTIVFVLLPFLCFNIVSWLITKRAVNKNIIVSKNFLRNTFIWWIIFSIIFLLIGSLQPYNRVVLEDKYFDFNKNEISKWWTQLNTFNKNNINNELLFLFYNCRTGNLQSDCLNNQYFWEEFSKEYNSIQELKKENYELYKSINKYDIYENIIYNNLDKQVYVKLLDIEQKVQDISKESFYRKWKDFYNPDNLYTYTIVYKLYKLLIEYNIHSGEFYRANELLNNYYNFVKSYNSWSDFEMSVSQIKFYFSQLEEKWYWDIVYPKNIEHHKNNYVSWFTRKMIADNNNFLYYLPDILFIFNKKQYIHYYFYHLKLIENNNFIFTYKDPILYYFGNNLMYKIRQDFDYYNKSLNKNIDLYDYMIKKSEY